VTINQSLLPPHILQVNYEAFTVNANHVTVSAR